MKFVVLLAVLFVAWMLWRRPNAAPPPGTSAAASAPQDMVECPVCHVHLPRGDAVADAQGRLFCSAKHRLAAPR